MSDMPVETAPPTAEATPDANIVSLIAAVESLTTKVEVQNAVIATLSKRLEAVETITARVVVDKLNSSDLVMPT